MKSLKSFVLVLASAILLMTELCNAQDNLQNAKNVFTSSDWSPKEPSKAFVLLAWGAPSNGETLRRQCADVERKKLENAFAKIKAFAPDRVVVKSLIDDDASYSNLYAECYRIAQEADVNDAVFVYVFTPTIMLIGKNDGIYRNGLVPLAPSTLHPDSENYGIKRKTIWNALSSRSHRLDALLVDVVPTCILSTPYRTSGASAGAVEDSNNVKFEYLTRFLLEGRGTLDVSSTRPDRGQGNEDAFAWLPYEWSSANASKEVNRSFLDDRLSGSLFCNALLSLAETTRFADSDLVADAFASKLADAIQERGETVQKTFSVSPKQTMTRFGRKGSEILVQESGKEE